MRSRLSSTSAFGALEATSLMGNGTTPNAPAPTAGIDDHGRKCEHPFVPLYSEALIQVTVTRKRSAGFALQEWMQAIH